MAVTRMSMADIQARRPAANLRRLKATSEAEIARQMREDGQDPAAPLVTAEWTPFPATIRKRLGMTQERFAATLRVPLATLRNWEQGRVQPEPAARSLLLVIEREPEAAMRALA